MKAELKGDLNLTTIGSDKKHHSGACRTCRKREKNVKQQKGFTLVEAAVAIGIVAILSGIIIPLVMKNLNDAKLARARNDINVIVAAIVSQQKDMGTRPVAGGPAGSAGNGAATWHSTVNLPAIDAQPPAPPLNVNNTFENLFTLPQGDGQAGGLFGRPAAAGEHQYNGPYLGNDMATKADPWGNAYIILGYNANGKDSGGPIWVVSAGPSGSILGDNMALIPGVNNLPATPKSIWDHTGISLQNIAVRAN